MGNRTRLRWTLLLAGAVGLVLASCSDAGPEPGFDVTGLWTETGGNSTIEFTAAGGYKLNFDPSLNGTTSFSGDSVERVDNATLTFVYVSGRAALEIIDVEVKIDSRHRLSFRLEDRRFRFTRAE